MKMARLVASGGGSGLSPVAPGTAGSVVGALIGAALLVVSPWALLAGGVLACGVGCAVIPAASGIPLFSATHGEQDDPGWIVIDEIAGQMLAMLALPRVSFVGVAVAFVLFRLLDILKPGPVGWADRKGGAAGVMGDDIIAGLSAALMVWGLVVTFPGWF
jgi:phosphatidylglycerophosphatase A